MQEGSGYRLEYALPVCHDVKIVEPQYPVALGCEECITSCVVLDVLGFVVLSAINLNDERGCMAQKIDDERTNRCLTAEALAMQSVSADRVPDDPLGIGQIAAQSARARPLLG
jgi:hypothetical protein